MINESKEYLTENIYIWESAKGGVPKHLDDPQARRLLKIAQEIKPGITFQIRECQECINELVKFVFTAYERDLAAIKQK